MLDQIKSEIKELEAQQKSFKPQRKTVHFTGNRTVEPWKAVLTTNENKYLLRHLYIVYAILRGKSLDVVEPNRKTEPSQYMIEKLTKKYTPVEIQA